MSIRIVCDNCGRVIFSAAAPSLLKSGYRCPCGAVPRIDEPAGPGEPRGEGDGGPTRSNGGDDPSAA
jgi:hypothetical protein